MLRSWLVGLMVILALAGVAVAHPHVFISGKTTVVFKDGAIVAVRHVWSFDDAYSAYAVQGLDADGDGEFSEAELRELAEVNIESLKDFEYFTFAGEGAENVEFGEPLPDYRLVMRKVPIEDYWLLTDEDRAFMREQAAKENTPELLDARYLEMTITVPLKTPYRVAERFEVDVYDPNYYIAYSFGKDGGTALENAPADCRIETKPAGELDDATAAALAAIPADRPTPPEDLLEITNGLANRITVICGPVASGPSDAMAAIERLVATADGGAQPAGAGGTPTGPAVVAEAGPAAAGESVASGGKPAAEPGIVARVLGFVARQQNAFYKELRDGVRRSAVDGTAAFMLMLVSFAYGVFHAAGPGHGKAVITSYVLASNETARTGILLSFASAFAQAVTAIVLIGVAGVILRLTSVAIDDTARAFEIGSYGLIVLLGLWLVYTKILRHHDHDHDHDHDHGHDHGHGAGTHHPCAVDDEPVAVGGNWRERGGALAAIMTVGLRPCSGALIVLAFALSQGMMLAGIGAAFAMALGTGITVATLAGIAITAKGLAMRMAGPESRMSHFIHRAVEIGGALFVLFMGLLLFTAAVGFGATH